MRVFPSDFGIYITRGQQATPHTFYQGTPERVIQREFYRQTYLLGVRFDY
jgi:hypothetical protein